MSLAYLRGKKNRHSENQEKNDKSLLPTFPHILSFSYHLLCLARVGWIQLASCGVERRKPSSSQLQKATGWAVETYLKTTDEKKERISFCRNKLSASVEILLCHTATTLSIILLIGVLTALESTKTFVELSSNWEAESQQQLDIPIHWLVLEMHSFCRSLPMFQLVSINIMFFQDDEIWETISWFELWLWTTDPILHRMFDYAWDTTLTMLVPY